MYVVNTGSCITYRYDCSSGRTYELISESEGADQEAQVNAATLTEDPGQSSEESKAELASDYCEGKPRT